MPPLAVLVLEFDPILRFGETEVRLETVVLAIVMAATLLVAGLIARATPAGEPDEVVKPGLAGEAGEAAEHRGLGARLRPDDLLFVAMGILPGAVVGGRLGYVLLHLDYYLANPGAIADPAQGGLELALAVVGGTLTAAYVLDRLGAPVGRWAHVAIFPLLLGLGAGKIVGVLGADGQGAPSDLPWATVYVADGPWGSLAPEIASHASQAYEGIATLLVLQVMTILVALGVFRQPSGRAFLVGLTLWSLVRAGVATTWRDAPVVGPLLAGQLIALAVAAACVGLLLARRPRSLTPRPRPAGHAA